MRNPVERSLLSPRAPRAGNAFTRWIGRNVLRLGGWRMEGDWPDMDKLLILVAPHSSVWDGIWGLAAKLALGVDLHIMAKAELFRGVNGLFLGRLLRWLGAMPIDRHAANGVVGQSVAAFQSNPKLWLLLAPEGTRRRVDKWRSGFWHIARAADVPVLCAWFHYPDRVIGLGQVIRLSDDQDADMAMLREYYRPYVGKNRGTV